jgi:hypothetical protein
VPVTGDLPQNQEPSGVYRLNRKQKTMKTQIVINQLHLHPGRLGAALAALLLLVTAASSSAQVLPPNSHPYGLSYEEWAVKWWQWSFSLSTNDLELVGTPDLCRGDATKVRFLAGVYIPGNNGISIETRVVTIDSGTPLFLSVLAAEEDNTGCNGDMLDFATNTVSELIAEAAGQWSAVTSTTCTIDGVSVGDLGNPATTPYLVVSPPFSYTTAKKGNVVANLFGVPCLPGGYTVYPAVTEGVYLMIHPLPPGKHVINFVGIVGPASAPYVESDLTYDITVSRDCK